MIWQTIKQLLIDLFPIWLVPIGIVLGILILLPVVRRFP